MNSSPDIIRELEIKRKAMNERLMNAKDVAEANGIERELWALRAAIRYHRGSIARETRALGPRSVTHREGESCGASKKTVGG